MASIEITHMSSKGQVVIPKDMREDIAESEKLVIIKNGHQIIIEKMDRISKTLEEDLEFAKRTRAAWKRYENGEFRSMPADKFLKELEKW